MGGVRRAAKTDRNHRDIVTALRMAGWSVQSLAGLAGGVPDVLAGKGGVNVLIEIKDGQRPPSDRRLTPDQRDWHAAWRGQVIVVESVEQALEAVRE